MNTIFDAENAIRVALADYFRYTSTGNICADDFSAAFISRLAKDNWEAKTELRELFRKSPAWNEELQAIIINGNRTHEPNFSDIDCWIRMLLCKIIHDTLCNDRENFDKLDNAINFFSCEDPNLKQAYLNDLQEIAPKAYREGKKLSRVFKDFCKALGVTAETNENFNRLYAKIADEMTSKKIDFKLYVSINPAHFLTMSNPYGDSRGATMVSCHALNSDYQYKNGCSGYARDNYSFIVFTASDPNNPETLNNRKTTRQIFAYKPYNGVLLQSRMYTSLSGGSYGGVDYETPEGTIYRDLIQRELSCAEDTPNLWHKKEFYCDSNITLEKGAGFGGYPDWEYNSFKAIVSVRKDDAPHKEFTVGTYGLCISCGEECDENLYCESCGTRCEHCNSYCREEDLTLVYGANGNTMYVCPECLDNYYAYCEHCGEWHHIDNMTWIDGEGSYICNNCVEKDYECCPHCGEWHLRDEMVYIESSGEYVCEDCLNSLYTLCEECGNWVNNEFMTTAVDANGEEIEVCSDCIENWYTNCINCGSHVHIDNANKVDGGHICPNCQHNHDESEEEI